MIILLCGIIAACKQDIGNESITKLLTPEERTEFAENYENGKEFLQYVNNLRFKNETAFFDFDKVTYKQFYDYRKTIADNHEKWLNEASENYRKEYDWAFAKADSAFQYWEQWEIDNRLDKQVAVTPKKLYRDADGNIFVSFDVDSKIGEINSVNLTFRLSENVKKLTYSMLLGQFSFQQEYCNVPFTHTTVNDLKIYPTSYNSYENELLALKDGAPADFHKSLLDDIDRLSISEFIEKYGFSIEASEIARNGKSRWSFSHVYEMPKSIQRFWMKSPNHDGIPRIEQMRPIIFKDLLHLDIPTEWEYQVKYIEDAEMSVDSLSYMLDKIS